LIDRIGLPDEAGVLIPSVRGGPLVRSCREKNLVRVSYRAEGSSSIMGAASEGIKWAIRM
jgi:hypothetical protein